MTVDDVIAKVKSLQFPAGSYVVFGSGPMAALGIREVNDVDLLVSKELHAGLRKADWEQITKGPGDEPLVKDDFEAHDNWDFSPYAPTLSDLLSRALVIDGVAFASIGDVRKWKESSGGAKHMSDVKLIDDYLARQSAIQEIEDIWSKHLATIQNWERLVEGIDPKVGGCGLVYELPNPIDRPNESFAIADMRQLTLSEPHKHINGETEIYFVLQGEGKVVVGTELHELTQGTCIITPPDTMHITLAGKGLVLAVVNTPPFNLDNYVAMSEADGAVAAAKRRLHSSA